MCRPELKQLYSALVSGLHPQFWTFLPFMDISASYCSSASKHIRVTYNSADFKMLLRCFHVFDLFFRIKTKIVQKVRASFPCKDIAALQRSWNPEDSLDPAEQILWERGSNCAFKSACSLIWAFFVYMFLMSWPFSRKLWLLWPFSCLMFIGWVRGKIRKKMWFCIS